jgi:hypothetical protein
MAKAGEVEVFSINPEVGKCYEHIEATRSEYTRGKGFKYYTNNSPRYVGKFIREQRMGSGDGQTVTAVFDDNGTKNSVNYSYEGYTCFKEVPCKNSGGMRKRSRRTRRKLKTRKHRK